MKENKYNCLTIRQLMEKFPEDLDTPLFLDVEEDAVGYIPFNDQHCSIYEDDLEVIGLPDYKILTISASYFWEPQEEKWLAEWQN